MFIRTQYRRKTKESSRYISLTGMLVLITYMNDAMFNFPLERADTQLYLAISMSLILIGYIREREKKPIPLSKSIIYLIAIITIPISSIETMHFASSIMQKEKILQTNGSKRVNYTSEQWAKRFPPIPTIDESTNPIALSVGMRFDAEKKYRQAIDHIINDNSNPYYGLKEFRLSNYYLKLGKPDSAEYYARKCMSMKPICYDPVRTLHNKYIKTNQYDIADTIISNFLVMYKTEPKAWIDLINIKLEKNEVNRAIELVDSALYYNPDNDKIMDLRLKIMYIK